MILQISPTSKIHNISRIFSMLFPRALRRSYSRVNFRGLTLYRMSREMIFWCCFIFLFSPACSGGLFRGTRRYCVARGLFFFLFFLRVAFSYLHPETNRVSCLPRIYIHRRLRVSNARRRPSTRLSTNDIVITMSWEYWLRAWNAYPK